MESKKEFRERVNKLLKTGLEADRNIVKAWLLNRYSTLHDRAAVLIIEERIAITETGLSVKEYYDRMYCGDIHPEEIHVNMTDLEVERDIDFSFWYKGKLYGYNNFIVTTSDIDWDRYKN